jgi:hypothetical protein
VTVRRLLDSDPDELRSEYLCDFGALYHFPAPVVDALRFLDFVQYIIGIQAERERHKQKPSEQFQI